MTHETSVVVACVFVVITGCGGPSIEDREVIAGWTVLVDKVKAECDYFNEDNSFEGNNGEVVHLVCDVEGDHIKRSDSSTHPYTGVVAVRIRGAHAAETYQFAWDRASHRWACTATSVDWETAIVRKKSIVEYLEQRRKEGEK